MSTVSPGLRLHDRFVLAERIGAGGMSQVWRATDEVLSRPVAVKMLFADLAADPALREATWREARAAGQLTHPNVTRVYDYGEAPLPDGSRVPYLVMELVEGQSLATRLAAGPLPWRETARIGAQVAAALAAAHQVGVVHHDVKPGNVMLTPDGAKVLDFGIAALVGAAAQEMLVGTPTYVAPERLRQAPAHPANDLYSLGVLLHECLTGHPPARLADWPEAAAAHRDGQPPAPALPGDDLPAELVELVTSCLSAEPDRRPPARQVATSLSGFTGAPDPAATLPADPPTVVTPLRYAVGSAALPAATAMDARSGATRIDEPPPERAGAPGRGRLMLVGVIVGAVVLALILALAIAALQRPGPPGDAALTPPATAEQPTGATTGPQDPPPQEDPGEQEQDVRLPGALADAPQIVRDLDRLIDEAFTDDRITLETARDLWDELEELREELEDPDYNPGERLAKVQDAAADMDEEIEDLLDDDEIPSDLAAQMRDLLRPLLPRGDR